MISGFENPTPEQIKANQIQDLYRLLYPLIQKDFLHVEDAKAMHLKLNAENTSQVLAFEALRATFNSHIHTVITTTGPAISSIPAITAFVQMQPISTLPNSLFAQSLVEPPKPPVTLLPRKIGIDTSINPFKIE